ncbi:hypothetical protein M8C21_013940 [Ambrosia artemisiifolia]|uniref:Uncharacterized protein n=1 Tax=Ambrosia artemisiifolia TaxID=4212 RepID=A0AAD5GA16_AMBAR|nr:hypothetical protein M8C21_013940 [Ambrosia artemisiifolia]
MSRRDRDSDSRHHRSRLDPESSPKRVKRDGDIGTERPTSNVNSTERYDRDRKHHRRLQDSVPLGRTVITDSKSENVSLSKESDRKRNGYREGTKNSSDNIEVPRSRSHVQHDERAGQVGRSFRDKETTERESWKDKKPKDDKTRSDDLYKVEPDSKQISKKRPSFRETKTKLPVNESATQGTKTQVNAEGGERKEERGKPLEKPPVDRPDTRMSGGRDSHRNETQRMKFQSRSRYGDGGNRGGVGNGFGGSFRGRDRFNERQRQAGGRVEKWKHDLYDEANKSPTKKKEEDQIAKVEALLAS